MAVRNRRLRRRLRKGGPAGFADRIETITTPRDRPPGAPEFGSGVLPPGVSRYQRNSAHLPSGVDRFDGVGVLPVDAAIDLTEDQLRIDLGTSG